MYESAGIDPREKLIVFADSLNRSRIDELEHYFRGRIKTTFGIGTNDLGPPSPSIVVKPAETMGLPVVKLSGDVEKATGNPGNPAEIERMKRLVSLFCMIRNQDN